MRSPALPIICLATVILVGCSHNAPKQPKVPKAPVVLNADDQHAKVIFKVVTTRAIASFNAGRPGNLVKIGNVYNDADEQQLPGFAKGLMKGVTHAFGRAQPGREILVPAGDVTEIQGSTGSMTDDGMYRRTFSCGPVISRLSAQANKTYLVEFDVSGYECFQHLFELTSDGQKHLIAATLP